jgi:hypothetical protein
MFTTAEEIAKEIDALANPVAGDLWHEMYSAWVLVLNVDAGTVIVKGPCRTWDGGAQILTWTRAEWKRHMTYETMPDTPCMSLHSRGRDVSGTPGAAPRERTAKDDMPIAANVGRGMA